MSEQCWHYGFSDAPFYNWWTKFGGMDISDAMVLKARKAEDARRKRLLAEAMLDSEVLMRPDLLVEFRTT